MEEGAAAAEMEEDRDKMEMEEETTLIEERRQGGGLESLWDERVDTGQFVWQISWNKL